MRTGMRVVLTGAAGQLGLALQASVPEDIELIALTRQGLDLADSQACTSLVHGLKPDWVLNAGAYTAVDRAESEHDLAQAVNAGAPAAFAEALAETGGRLLQVSTDFVFAGNQGSPYRPNQPVQPLGVYGSSKADGETAALALPGGLVRRSSWVYGTVGQNFCRTMLKLHAAKAALGEPLGVVADQVGCPTATHTLASACWRALGIGASPDAHRPDQTRILHHSDAGAASWYDFAVAIGELGVISGLLERAAQVNPISTADYPTPAQRPAYSLLDCTLSRAALGIKPIHWRVALAQVLASMG